MIEEAASQAPVVVFGPFQLSIRERRLDKESVEVRIGSRALEILIALAERAGEVVSNEELTARVWPDTAVEASALRVHIAALRKALGDGHLGARYILNVPGRGYSLVARLLHSVPDIQALPACRDPLLPARLERIVGRNAAIDEISEQLLSSHFVSIIAPGGMGKTTVAVAVAHALLPDFAHDVSFVDLGSLADAQQVFGSIAVALGFKAAADDAVSSLVTFLEGRRTLLVLDCCEHVMATVAPLAERIFGGTARVHILTTSREPLRVEGEHVYRMLPLESPRIGDKLTAIQALMFRRFSSSSNGQRPVARAWPSRTRRRW